MKQLVKIIPLLSSNQPGEVVAAAAAIGRTLAAAGKDWHWLAGSFNGGSSSSQSSYLKEELIRRELDRARSENGVLRLSMLRLREENGRLLVSVGKLEDRLTSAANKISELQRKVVELSTVRDGHTRVDAAAPLRDRPNTSQWEFRVSRMLSDHVFDGNLSNRSFEFLCSVRDQIKGGHSPKGKQIPWLEDLWVKYKDARTKTRRAS